jgi:hypothetical protein
VAENWYFVRGGIRHGPVSGKDLKRLAQFGELLPVDLVWTEGMKDWKPARRIKDLFPTQSAADVRAIPATSDGVAPPAVPLHFLDHLIGHLRSMSSATDFAYFGAKAIDLGRYSLYAAMLVGFGLALLVARETKRVDTLLAGIVFAVLALVLQYSSIRLSRVTDILIRAAPARMASTAFLDSFGVVFLVGGVVGPLVCLWAAIRAESIPMVFVAIAIFIACELPALLAVNPTSLNIEIDPTVSSGDEAISILSFFIMLPLRFVPMVFGLGTAVGVLGLLVSGYLLLKGGDGAAEGVIWAIRSGFTVLACAAFPSLMYVYSVFYYLLIDIIRALLLLPQKADRMNEKR